MVRKKCRVRQDCVCGQGQKVGVVRDVSLQPGVHLHLQLFIHLDKLLLAVDVRPERFL